MNWFKENSWFISVTCLLIFFIGCIIWLGWGSKRVNTPHDLETEMQAQFEMIKILEDTVLAQEEVIEFQEERLAMKDDRAVLAEFGMAACFKACNLVIQKCKEEIARKEVYDE